MTSIALSLAVSTVLKYCCYRSDVAPPTSSCTFTPGWAASSWSSRGGLRGLAAHVDHHDVDRAALGRQSRAQILLLQTRRRPAALQLHLPPRRGCLVLVEQGRHPVGPLLAADEHAQVGGGRRSPQQ